MRSGLLLLGADPESAGIFPDTPFIRGTQMTDIGEYRAVRDDDGKFKLRPEARTQIRDRLRQHIRERPGRTVHGFEKATGLESKTVEPWLRSENPVIPETVSLIRMAETVNLSIDWLLLGDEPPLRERQSSTIEEKLRARVIAVLRSVTDEPLEVLEKEVPTGKEILRHFVASLATAISISKLDMSPDADEEEKERQFLIMSVLASKTETFWD
jgi:transcriptional regulator with XRE-family HTH domain